MNLLTLGQQSTLLLGHTFSLVSKTRCQHKNTSNLSSLWDQAVKDFGHGHDSIIMDCVNTPELDTCLDEADAMPSAVFSRFLHLVSSISNNSRPLVAPGIKLVNYVVR